jgi:hypothetical protein
MGNCVHAVTQRKEIGLRFFELINPVDEIRGEANFSAWRFRPWEEQLSAEDRAERFEPVFVEVRHDVDRRLEMEVSS